VLRLGHHGSGDATSYSFLDQTSPNIAVISVGIDNEFYDPNPTLLSRLEDKGIDVFRTDLDGTIQITLSKYDIIDVQKEK
jgi:beta-lactamase superfamily II metal-dependent hydrolase